MHLNSELIVYISFVTLLLMFKRYDPSSIILGVASWFVNHSSIMTPKIIPLWEVVFLGAGGSILVLELARAACL